MIFLRLSRERDEAPTEATALGPGSFGPCLKTSLILWVGKPPISAGSAIGQSCLDCLNSPSVREGSRKSPFGDYWGASPNIILLT
ncbi:hypothetical protein TNCV_5001261 [Trichonephila clavipes]|nr:hypothetical protein TNCV_5001261 [Trichonephila clavipes]